MISALVVALLAQVVTPTAILTDAIGVDYVDANIVSGGVTRFERQFDGGAWASVGMPTKFSDALTTTGASTYRIAFPTLTAGNHTVAIRACNASQCSDPTPIFSFFLTVKLEVPTNARVVK